jgi:hypothetical protein
MEESENLKIIVDKDKWAYTICLCIYNVTAQLAGQLSLVAERLDVPLLMLLLGRYKRVGIGQVSSIH